MAFERSSFEQRAQMGLRWIKQSFEPTNFQGSCAYYHKRPFLKGKWSKAYPETTGYIIPTLIAHSRFFNQTEWNTLALGAAKWLVETQLDSGAFPAGLVGNQQPSIFNTGQIILGLVKAYEVNQEQELIDSAIPATKWLLGQLATDGSWKTGAYREGYIPSYYTRVIWPVLLMQEWMDAPNLLEQMRLALQFYQKRISREGWIQDWSFAPRQAAYTHTIAYTLRGFLESYLLLGQREAINLIEKVAERFIYGPLAGAYNNLGKGDYSFKCLTGHAQLSLFFLRLYEVTGQQRYLTRAKDLFQDIIPYQNHSNNQQIRGAIPGSTPYWKSYQPFRYPNWATKFFLDTNLGLFKALSKDNQFA